MPTSELIFEQKDKVIKLKMIRIKTLTFDIETATGKKTMLLPIPLLPQVNAILKELEEFKEAIENNTRTINRNLTGTENNGCGTSDSGKNQNTSISR